MRSLTPQHTIERAIWDYPYLHQNRTQTLEYIFCVSGGSYKWQDGKIVCDGPRRKPAVDDFGPTYRPAEDKWRAEHRASQRTSKPDFIRQAWDEADAEWDAEERLIRSEWRERSRQTVELDHTYPLSQSANIMKIPDDVTPAWLDMCEEVVEMILHTVTKGAYKETPQREFAEQQRKTDRRYAQIAKKRITAIRAARGIDTRS